MKKRAVILVIIIIVLALIAAYLTFFYTKKCSDASCFNDALSKCRRASFISDEADAAWNYNIAGKSGGECKINVVLLQLKQGTNEMMSLEGKEMICYTQLGAVTSPQGNLANCHGLLKEEMQSLIINKLHNYIVGNLGTINSELEKAV